MAIQALPRITRRTMARDMGTLASAAGIGLPAALAAACSGGQSAPGVAGRPAAAGCRSKLEFWSVFGANSVAGEGTTQAVTEFAQKRPGCAVETTVVPSAQMREKVVTAQVGGAPPALIGFAPSWVPEWSVTGILAPVDDLFKRDKLNGADFPPAQWMQMSWGGKVWFMPIQANTDFVLHWNKAHFREAGLNPDKGPETLAELDTIIPKLTLERGGDLERVGMQPWDLYGLYNTIQAWGAACGGSFYDQSKDELTFMHPRVLRAVEWFTGWAQRLGAPRVKVLSQQVTVPGIPFFAFGRFSIHPLTYATLQGVRRHDPAMEIGAGPFPGEPPGKVGSLAIGGWATAAIAGSPKREEAWEVMRYLGADEEGTTTVARTGVGIPGWLKSPVLAELSKDPLMKAYVDALKRAEYPQIGFYSPAGYKLELLQEIIDGKRGVREVMEEINRDANLRYREWKSQVKKG